MRKLLWLLPAVLLIPALISLANWYWWFITGDGFLQNFTERHALTAAFSSIVGTFVLALVADAQR